MKALLYKDFLMLQEKRKDVFGLYRDLCSLWRGGGKRVFLLPFELPLSLHGGDNAAGPGGAGKMGRLWRASAVSRKVQTAEKYLFSVLGLLAGILINLIFNLVGGTNTGDFLDVLPVILIVGLLFAAFELPLIYKVGIGKAKLGYLFLAGLAIAAVAIFTRITGENSEAWRIVFSWEVLWGGAAASFLAFPGVDGLFHEYL